jgi:threonine/homoserine/homoserine lactone efflux protein
MGVLVHVCYTLLGLGLVLQQTRWLFNALKLVGAAYLIYLGIKMLRSKPAIEQLDAPPPAMSDLAALRMGFLTNALNPKTSIFIVSLFIGVVRPDTALAVQIAYGLFIAGAHAVWFSLIALCFSVGMVRKKLVAARQLIDRIFGGLLVSFGILLTIAQRSG